MAGDAAVDWHLVSGSLSKSFSFLLIAVEVCETGYARMLPDTTNLMPAQNVTEELFHDEA